MNFAIGIAPNGVFLFSGHEGEQTIFLVEKDAESMIAIAHGISQAFAHSLGASLPAILLTNDVVNFHFHADVPIVRTPSLPPHERRDLRHSLVLEEAGELLSAIDQNDLAKIADSIADLIYVCLGTAIEYGIPMDGVWQAVQNANMAKVMDKGSIRRAEDGKILKPEGWTPPDIAGLLKAVQERNAKSTQQGEK